MGLIITTRNEVANRLAADPYFEDIPILPLLPKETLSELENRLNRMTISGTVLIPRLGSIVDNLPGPYFDKIEVHIGFCEDRMKNNTGKLVEDAIEKAAALLHLWTPQNLSKPFRVEDPGILEIPAESDADKKKRLLVLRCVAAGGLAYELPKVETPVVANVGGSITITCGTPGAAIFYRQDGKQPSPRAGTFYTAPFAPVGTVKARAFLAGFETSDLTTFNI